MRIVNTALLVVLLTCVATTASFGQGRGFRGGRGPDKNFVTDRDDFHFLLEHHDQVRREVKELANGVETLTESDNKEVAAKIQKHVVAMYQRVENVRPIRMRDPLFAEIFKHADKINMEFEKTSKGVRVTETSDDAYVAKLIKAHAKAVSGFAKYGFEEAHKTHALPGKPGTGGVAMHRQEEIQDMVFVEFDRVYIPALALTNQMQRDAATKALGRLSKSWETRFVEHFHEMFDDDSQWPRDVSQIAQAIAWAEAELESGELLKAHEKLEPVRDILMNARRRNQLDYPLDTLSRFHATMEAIVKPAMRLDAATIGQTQIDEFARLAQQAEQEWQVVERTKFDLASFGQSEQQQAQFPSLLRAERLAIGRLNDALARNDKHAILMSARGLKPPYAKVYMSFGAFPQQTPEQTRAAR